MKNSTTEVTFVAVQSTSFAGDVQSNVAHHAEQVEHAAAEGADVVVFPELSLTGYEPTLASQSAVAPDDSVLSPLQTLADDCEVCIIAGCPIRSDEAKPYLGAFVFRPKADIECYLKRFLHPGEDEHFLGGSEIKVIRHRKFSIGVAICADVNREDHPRGVSLQQGEIYAAGVAMTPGGILEAQQNMSTWSNRYRMVSLMANYAAETGGYPMAGRSSAWDAAGRLLAQAGPQGESLIVVQGSKGVWKGRVVANETTA